MAGAWESVNDRSRGKKALSHTGTFTDLESIIHTRSGEGSQTTVGPSEDTLGQKRGFNTCVQSLL